MFPKENDGNFKKTHPIPSPNMHIEYQSHISIIFRVMNEEGHVLFYDELNTIYFMVSGL